MQFENEKTEFKEKFVPDIYKEVIAFANTDGGVIFVGVNDKGERIGLDEVDDEYTRITNGIRDAILPDVTMFVKYTLEEGRILRIEVSEGTYKPYYLKAKGLRTSGVYVRQGASSVQASQEQIRQMIKKADGDGFETLRSLKQELTFHYASNIFEKNKMSFTEEKYLQLGIKSPESNLFTNLGQLLSDQCEYTVKIAVFGDNDNTIFKDKKEFTGSVLAQLEEAYNYLRLCNQNRAVIDGLVREDRWDYPEAAIREALLNALIHRDYNYGGSIIININSERMEFISIGGLLPGISPEDIRNGISLPRNRGLAELFYRLRFIESYGTGIRRIYSLYRDCGKQPEIFVTSNSFRIILPNVNAADRELSYIQGASFVREPVYESILQRETGRKAMVKKPAGPAVTGQMKKVLSFISENGAITPEEVQALLDIKTTRAYIVMRQLTEAGMVEAIGRGGNKKYVLKDVRMR